MLKQSSLRGRALTDPSSRCGTAPEGILGPHGSLWCLEKPSKSGLSPSKAQEGNRLTRTEDNHRATRSGTKQSPPKKRASENATVADGAQELLWPQDSIRSIPQAKSTHSPSNPQPSTKTRVRLTQGLRPSSGAVPQHKKRALSGPFLVRGLSEHRGRSDPSGSQDYPLRAPCRPSAWRARRPLLQSCRWRRTGRRGRRRDRWCRRR